jgi:hypothetical protein
MKFVEDLLQRTLTFVDNHPRWLAGAVLVYSLLAHPYLTVVSVLAIGAWAYFANEAKK